MLGTILSLFIKSTRARIITAVIFFLLLGGTVWLAYHSPQASAPSDSVSSPAVTQPAADETPTGEDITKAGEYMCLPHKDTSGAQTQECALGLKGDDGKYYALRDTTTDYHLLIGIPTGKQVTITGKFTAGTSDTYPTAGTIAVTAVQ